MAYLRTHNCGELRSKEVNQEVTLMGWVHHKRDLGHLLFIELRDSYGFTQIVADSHHPDFAKASSLKPEYVIKVKGKVQPRAPGMENKNMPTGAIEVSLITLTIESEAQTLPFPVAHETVVHDDLRLTYRFLDLRTQRMQRNVKYRSQFIKYLRDKMTSLGFNEIQTPILTASSPEGARDFLVPSRLHAGKFYALPQAPQQFKQLLMCSGFDRYFQIAPCFRDEDPRADRSPGEFYQLDMEMSFVTQDEIFEVVEEVMLGVFGQKAFSSKALIPKESYKQEYQRSERRLPCIPWKTAMERYGSDKPDLRYTLEMEDVSSLFSNSAFSVFKDNVGQGNYLKAIRIKSPTDKSRRFFDDLTSYAKQIGLDGLPWLLCAPDLNDWKGSCAKFLSVEEKEALQKKLHLQEQDAVVFVLGAPHERTLKKGGLLRTKIASSLNLIDPQLWSLLWIVDFPMYEMDEKTNKIDFSHNPFSMPQVSLEDLTQVDPLSVHAYQYDLVCNGIEIASGAIRNHRQDIMKAVFALAGYSEEDLKSKFKGLWEAFSYGAPPHGGVAPGIDRILMLLLDEENIREVIPFPLNQQAMDPMMNAPSPVSSRQLEDIHIRIVEKS
jgi:aspartyl-tRNA synthetase